MTLPGWVWAAAFVVGLFAVGLGLLWRANLPRPLRHRQAWSPVAAALLTALALLAYHDVVAPLHQVGSQVLAGVQGLLARGGLAVPNAPGALVLLANLVLLLGYVLLKRAVNAAVRRLHPHLGRFGVAPAYGEEPDEGACLLPEWDFPGRLLRWAGAVVGGAVVLLAVATVMAPPPAPGAALPFALPALFVAPALLLLEAGWYLGGPLRVAAAGSVTGEGVEAARVGAYEALWEEYQALWPGHLLAASRHLPPAGVAAATAPDPRPERDADEVAALRVWHRLLGQGHALTDAHRDLLLRLWRGEDALVEAAGYEGVGPVVLAALHRALTAGHRALVLLPAAAHADARTAEAVAAWLRDGLRAADEVGADWEVADLGALRRHGARPDVLLAAPAELLQTGALHDAWFERVRPVLVLDGGETVLAAPLDADALVRVLRARVTSLQRVVLAAGRRNLEAAVRATLGAAPREYRPPRPAPTTAFALVWRREHQPWFQAAVLRGAPTRYLGAAPVLALPAWREGVRPVLLLGHEGLPWDELVEEIENHRAGLAAPVAPERLRGTAREVLEVPAVGPLLPRRPRAFAVAYDRQCNAPAALAAALPLGHDAAFVHVVAPPYLLRDYLAAHAGYFLRAPLRPLAPRVGDSAAAVAYALLERMTAGPVEEAEVLRELRAVVPEARFVEDALPAVFEAAFALDLRRHDALRVEEADRFDPDEGAFVPRRTYRLDPEVRRLAALDALRPFRVLDGRDDAVGLVPRGWLHQRYLPRQVHAFQGKPHEVGRVDEASGVLRVDFRDVAAPHTYRPVLEVALDAFHLARSPAHRRRMEHAGWRVEAALGQGAFRVRTRGYYAFPGPIHLTGGAARFEPLADVPERAYPHGRLLRLTLTPPAAAGVADPAAAADALAVLLGEAARTLFPETHPFLLVAAPDGGAPDGGGGPAEGPRRALRPRLVLGEGGPPAEDGAVAVYAFEDAPAPMGLMLALLDAWEEVLALLDDYLRWVYEEEPEGPGPEAPSPAPPEEASEEEGSVGGEAVRPAVPSPDPDWRLNLPRRDAYLRYGLEAPPLDAGGAHRLLRAFFGDANGLTRERRAHYAPARAGGPAAPRRACDFCGEEAFAAEFERLADGRERCAACAGSAVDTLAELRALLKEARRFFARDMGHPVRRDVHVAFAGPDRIAAAARGRFMPTAEFDRRALGLAVRQGRHYAVLVENGHPRHVTLATVVHELTHVWQHAHLDVERMRAEHGLLLIEGHAVWAELACLARRELAPAYRERQAGRVDVYGHGYRYVQAWLEREPEHRTAFDLLLATYPRR